MQRRKTGGVVRIAAAAALVAAAGCAESGDHLLVRTPPQGGGLFERYVSLGNSITAGMISSGLTAETQQQAYPVLLAQAAGAEFGVPLLVAGTPGCPVPLAGPLTPSTEQPVCVRAVPAPRVVQNVAVPNARIADLFRIPAGEVAGLHTLLVGHQTQAEAMISARPTFVSVWIGNNDALAAAISGVLGPHAAGAPPALTPLAEFQASVNQLATAIQAAGPAGAMLVGVVDPVIAVPLLQPGAFFFAARDAQGRFQGKPVNLNCSPLTALGQLNPLARNLVSFRILADPNLPEINCDPAAYGGRHLLDTQEQAIVRQRVADYNTALAAAAATHGWLFVDPNQILGQYLMQRDADGRYPWLRKCQDLATAATPLQLQAAVLNSCPVTGPTAAPTFFGALMSHDGVHPSAAAHSIFAGRFAAAINAQYGTSLAPAAN
jgi:lysophospholipase L1-like esterase